MKVTHHVVYSTKGGCGKTVFSLWLALCELSYVKVNSIHFGQTPGDISAHSLFGKNSEEKTENSGEQPGGNPRSNSEIFDPEHRSVNCFIDFDLLGSSITYSLGINPDEVFEGKNSCITLQHLLLKTRRVSDLKLFKAAQNQNGKKSVFMIPVDAREKEKAIFHVKRKNTPLLRYEEMQTHLDAIQKGIELYLHCRGFNVNDELHFIYDMPPNADGYTEALFDELIARKGKGKDGDDRVRIYLVSNSIPMLECNIDWLNSFMTTFQNRGCDTVIINNNNIGGAGNGTKVVGGAEISDIISKRRFSKDVDSKIKLIGNIDGGKLDIDHFNKAYNVGINVCKFTTR